VIRIDKKLPKKYRKPVAFHERVERKLMLGGMPYPKAHRIANKKEREKYFKRRPKSWRRYMRVVKEIEKKNAR
jgi:hypothetical protein